MFKKISLFYFFVFVLMCDVFAAQPSWITSIKKDAKNYYFVGYAEDMDSLEKVKEKAIYNAKSKIASSIFEETEVEKIFSTYGGLSENEDLSRAYREEIKSRSIVQLVGVELDDMYYEKVEEEGLSFYKVWVLVKVSKIAFENERDRIISELKRKLELVDENLKLGEEELKKGNVLEAINAFYSAALSSIKVKERKEEFPLYISKIVNILKNIYIEEYNVPAEIDVSKENTFSFRVVYSDGKNELPLSGAKVNFVIRNNKGKFSTQAISAKDGIVTCRIDSLSEINDRTVLYVKLSLDFPELLESEPEFKKYYSTLLDSVQKISKGVSFSTYSGAKKKITTAVITLIEEETYKKDTKLTSEAQSILTSKGYRVKKIPDTINPRDIVEAKSSSLEDLKSEGIARVVVILVTPEKPKYNETLERYVATYNLTVQFIETTTGEIISSSNKKLTITSQTEKANFASFLSTASKELKNLIK